jgi:aldose 1-epimerase
VVEQTEARIIGEFQAAVDDPTILERWPADFRVRVSYEIRGRELLSEIHYENSGDGPLPCGFATHAYFRLPLTEGSAASDTVVMAPVHKFWELDRMNPTGQIQPVPTEKQLAAGLRLNAHQFDIVFTDLRSDADGLLRTKLTDPKNGRTITQTFDATFTQCVVYTPPHREAICLEPYTCVPDAIRLTAEGHKTGLQILQPGESRQTRIRLSTNQ